MSSRSLSWSIRPPGGPADAPARRPVFLRRQRVRLAWLAAASLALLVFRGWPELDVVVTGWFYRPQTWPAFPVGEWAPVQLVYQAVPWLGRLALLLCLLACLLPRRRAAVGLALRWHRRAFALLLVLLLGLGALVNGVFKEGIGRPRPHTVQDFGGPHPFQPVGWAARGCEGNCSFVSGHAATGFLLMACGLVGGPATRRRWAWIGALTGASIGAGRVVQGGHFLSDIVFAGLAMGAVCLLLRAVWVRLRGWRLRRARLPQPLQCAM